MAACQSAFLFIFYFWSVELTLESDLRKVFAKLDDLFFYSFLRFFFFFFIQERLLKELHGLREYCGDKYKSGWTHFCDIHHSEHLP